MKKKNKIGDYLDKGPKKLQFGDVVSGAPTKKAKEGDKTYSKAVAVPEGSRTDKSSRIVYDSSGKRIGRRVAASTPKYVPDVRNAGSTSKQAAASINRSRGKTKAQMAAERRSEAGRQPAPRQSAQPDGPAAPPRRRRPSTPAPAARRPAPRVEAVKAKTAKAIAQAGPDKSLKMSKPAAKTAAPMAAKKPSGRAAKVMARAETRAGRIQDRRGGRMAKKAAKAGMRAEVKSARAAGKKMVKKAKGKAMMGKMKYQMGAVAKAKPDFLDMDKDGNKKESMKKALKDRRGKGGYGKKKK